LQKHIQKHLERTDKKISTITTEYERISNEHQIHWPSKVSQEIITLQQQQQQQQQQQPQQHSVQYVNTKFEFNQNQHDNDDNADDVPNRTSHNILQQHVSAADQHSNSLQLSSGNEIALASTINSAFTPINVMTSHLSSLQHQRPIYYDTIALQNKNVQQNTINSFPNQLISLHQIRNYTHQPSSLINSEHLISLGMTKEKGQ
jgi:hypothetical protein